MLTIFNRRELTVTFSLKRQVEIREALAAAGIRYSLRTRRDASSGRGWSAAGGAAREREYMFYVHRDDVDAAQAALRRI